MKGQVHKALKLAHHRHTARPLPHHHTSYRGLFVVVAFLGLTMATIQYAAADNYAVTAMVPGDTLTAPAAITSPVDGITVNDPNVTIKGTCQVVNSGTFVTITRDGLPIGTGECQSDSTFSIDVTLDLGANVLLPTETSGALVAGPDGTAVSVTYVLPPAPVVPSEPVVAPATTQPSTPISRAAVMRIAPQGPGLIERSLDRAVTIVFSVTSGERPYTVVADWGDGKVDTVQVETAGASIRLQHVYDTPGAYTITLKATDAAGHKAVYQYAAVAQATALSLSTPSATVVPPRLGYADVRSWVSLTRIVWTSYGLLSFAVIALWLASPSHSLFTHPALVAVKIRSVPIHRAKKIR